MYSVYHWIQQALDYGAYAPYGQASTYASYYGQGYAAYGNGTTSLPALSPTGLPGAVASAAAAAAAAAASSTSNFSPAGSYQLPHTLTSTSSSLSGSQQTEKN